MKKTLILVVLALMMTSCLPGRHKPEPKQSVAKEAVWDFFLVGTWKSPEATETFYGDGKYVCQFVDLRGRDLTIKGKWRLDDNENYVVWVTQKSVKDGKKTISSEKKELKYVINSLAPNKSLVYQVGDEYRSAEWVE